MSMKLLNQCLVIVFLFLTSHVIIADEPKIDVTTVDLHISDLCTNTFVPHELDHVTTVLAQPIGFYASNGAGLAINDLNNDGYLDIVLANLDGDNAIFWNQGGLLFEKDLLESASWSRAVNIVDVDGDGWQDIVFTQQTTAPLYWHNQQGERFTAKILRGVSYIGYTMNWTDMDRDGDLDFVTGSYDVEIDKILGQLSQTEGVIYYENRGDRFVANRLASHSNTLAILINDVNSDGQKDIIIGNDFADEDQYFSYSPDGWHELESLPVMPHSTMSYDAADINNNGQLEMYAVDMKPYADDDKTLAEWQPIMDMMMAMPHTEGDPQVMENVLYAADNSGEFRNLAPELALDGTGWSWSSKFGDLDNDGYQDLYVVNGMISVELFSHLPNNELVEENQVFRNVNGELFSPMSNWRLNATESGRGMSMADLDNDGDLDIVINNLMKNTTVYENKLCGGDSIEIGLEWQGSANTRAIGSQIFLHTSSGIYRRDVKVSSGYLSGDSSRIHFGFPIDTEILYATVIWSDGAQSTLAELTTNTLVTIIRD